MVGVDLRAPGNPERVVSIQPRVVAKPLPWVSIKCDPTL